MSEQIIPLIMSGGAGTRLWPSSRETRPKQFLPLLGQRSTFQETLRRVADPTLFARPVIMTNFEYRFLVAEQLAELGMDADILLEPIRRDSAPAIVAGTAFARMRGGDPIVAALAADHVVKDAPAFIAACKAALEAAAAGRIVTFGIKPDRAATEYGYIRSGGKLTGEVLVVDKFIEKPDAEHAARYVADGYLWNSGNFVFRASVLLDEYRTHDQRSSDAVLSAVKLAGRDLGFVTLDEPSFSQATANSIDYAVMEKTARAAVVPVSYGWSDVGSWNSVWDIATKDAAGNASQGRAVFVEARNSYVLADKALVALLGVEDLVVVASEDAVLVMRRDKAADMKKLIANLNTVEPSIAKQHLKVHRPWGSYQSLDMGHRYQVKRIVVKAGRRLSLQKHHHRAEHWVIVRGTAKVTVGDVVKTLHENESIYIPIGYPHRLENPGKIDLELIEVQTGSYLGEDDIIRIDDDYRRS
jgi:mannose-1-phosphate guanylyltransferase/mannose-6-phosphate isomerase